MVKKLYISGYITDHEEASKKWRKDWSKKLNAADYSIYDPLLEEGVVTPGMVKTIINKDIQRITTSDALILNADIPSWGSSMEVIYARLFRVWVFTVYSKLDKKQPPVWVQGHSDKVFKTIDEVIVHMNNMNGVKTCE